MTASTVSPAKNSGICLENGRRWTPADVATAALLTCVALVGYGALALRLAEGQYYDYYNLAFDFDASRVLSMLTRSPPDAFGFKHPFMLLLRPLGLALLAFGVPAKAAAGLVMAGVGAARVGLVFAFLRLTGIERAVGAALACLFAVSSTQLITAIVTETYGFASLSLILVWILAQLAFDAPERLRAARVAAAVFAAGVTITNAAQPIIAEACVAIRSFCVRAAIRHVLWFGACCAATFAVLAVVIWPVELSNAAQHPLAALQAIWWMQTKGPTTGLVKVLETVFGFSFVSPVYTVVPLPETTRMIDFREWSFQGRGGAVADCWIVACALGTVASFVCRGYRRVATAIGLSLLFNIWFHLGFQYRGSVYIYMAHTHFLVFALFTGLGVWVKGGRLAQPAYFAGVVLLTVGTGAINIPLAIDFAARFDKADTTCPAPCVDGLP